MKAILRAPFTDIYKGGELAECLMAGDEIEIVTLFNGCFIGCCESYVTFTHPEIEGECEGSIYESSMILDKEEADRIRVDRDPSWPTESP